MKYNYNNSFQPLSIRIDIKNRVMLSNGINYGEQNGEMSFLHISTMHSVQRVM
jgi:hypothetical protein